MQLWQLLQHWLESFRVWAVSCSADAVALQLCFTGAAVRIMSGGRQLVKSCSKCSEYDRAVSIDAV